MNIINYNAEMEKLVSTFGEDKPRLLLHACCAPCASACLERIKEWFDITVYFYNPNIDGEEEYRLRASELKRLCGYFKVKCVVEEFEPRDFHDFAKDMAEEKEGGARCGECFRLRLFKTCEKARVEEYDFFATTLTVSPLKNANLINRIGEEMTSKNTRYLPTDFKKKNGYLRSIELSKELNLYRQNFCGCIYSKSQSQREEK